MGVVSENVARLLQPEGFLSRQPRVRAELW